MAPKKYFLRDRAYFRTQRITALEFILRRIPRGGGSDATLTKVFREKFKEWHLGGVLAVLGRNRGRCKSYREAYVIYDVIYDVYYDVG